VYDRPRHHRSTASGIRPPKDGDAIVDVTSYTKYAMRAGRSDLSDLLKDTTPGAPLCRWRREDVIIDVTPNDGLKKLKSRSPSDFVVRDGRVHNPALHRQSSARALSISHVRPPSQRVFTCEA
jgi:hypothetical protein